MMAFAQRRNVGGGGGNAVTGLHNNRSKSADEAAFQQWLAVHESSNLRQQKLIWQDLNNTREKLTDENQMLRDDLEHARALIRVLQLKLDSMKENNKVGKKKSKKHKKKKSSNVLPDSSDLSFNVLVPSSSAAAAGHERTTTTKLSVGALWFAKRAQRRDGGGTFRASSNARNDTESGSGWPRNSSSKPSCESTQSSGQPYPALPFSVIEIPMSPMSEPAAKVKTIKTAEQGDGNATKRGTTGSPGSSPRALPRAKPLAPVSPQKDAPSITTASSRSSSKRSGRSRQLSSLAALMEAVAEAEDNEVSKEKEKKDVSIVNRSKEKTTATVSSEDITPPATTAALSSPKPRAVDGTAARPIDCSKEMWLAMVVEENNTKTSSKAVEDHASLSDDDDVYMD